MTKPYSEMAKEIINSVPESCFSNNSYREWGRSKEVLALAITKALEQVAKEMEAKSLRIRLERMKSWVALYLNNAKYWPIEIPGDGGKFDKMAFYKDFCKTMEVDLDE